MSILMINFAGRYQLYIFVFNEILYYAIQEDSICNVGTYKSGQ